MAVLAVVYLIGIIVAVIVFSRKYPEYEDDEMVYLIMAIGWPVHVLAWLVHIVCQEIKGWRR